VAERKAGDQVDDKPSSEIVQRDLLWAILSAAAAAEEEDNCWVVLGCFPCICPEPVLVK
jgi:hypothetical protein